MSGLWIFGGNAASPPAGNLLAVLPLAAVPLGKLATPAPERLFALWRCEILVGEQAVDFMLSMHDSEPRRVGQRACE